MWEKLCSRVVSVLDFNQATLSGCIDIICVRHKEVIDDDQGQSAEKWVYRSTPFHVRFGKAKLLKSREKTVSIYVNDELSDLTMKLGAAGEAFFGEETDDEDADFIEMSPDSSTRSPVDVLSEDERSGMMDYGYCAYNSKVVNPEALTRQVSEKIMQSIPAMSNMNSEDKDPEGNTYKIIPNDMAFDGKETSRSVDVDSGSKSWSWNWGDIPRRTTTETTTDKILQFSLCGHLLSSQDDHLNSELFRANLVDWERLDNDPSLWYHESLVACFDGRPPYYQSKIALPLLASWIVFNKPLSIGSIEKLLKMSLQASKDSENGIYIETREQPPTDTYRQGDSTFKSLGIPDPYKLFRSSKPVSRKRYKISLRPTSEQLESLNLKLGANKITFTVSSVLQGTKSVSATIYLWPSDAQIVITDVDGTITKSDALGHIMPILGRDWSHVGVAELFSKIRANGYYVLYLTARAIGQADYTREYLFGLTQNDKEKLPDGPLFLSPDRLLSSFKREVITKSAYMFKIPALRDIRNLFASDHNPFYAGFGNNSSDHRAYVSVGVPESRVFIINTSGIIKHVNSNYARTYETMSEIAELMFPPISSNFHKSCEDERYNSFQFWNFPIHMDLTPQVDDREDN
ncbi:LNS2 Lipin/Ned1/Smp2 domain-containing protein [Theileria equi strain WA]|uniref:phosphatidate phosphatase n=1 Tax=Theileria equi strain WA TaxID=1537102 RepID=L0B2K3_THEEQ|nr:LNS2 Lipin/Ned1/Smp2 domain-containing protein [Theileria equi strain WA]AFZ81441.1 LNS2 Lipin/Ned1/Smp2 domain-containing protein [Theileria equi strain WA]|eukprot:XP_004831107.1 LNS2 Lipin/Ned1/Smp2 domain-containing protein [Theileria equi strain WA]